MHNGPFLSQLGCQKEVRKPKRKTPPDALSQTRRLIASLSSEMEEQQRFYLCAAARGSWPRGCVRGRRRSAVVCTGGELRLHQGIVAAAGFWGVVKGLGVVGVIARQGRGMPSGDPRAGGHGHSAVKSHSEGKRRASFIYLCLKYLSVTRAVL